MAEDQEQPPETELPPETGNNLLGSLQSTFVEPELVRRVQAGAPVPPNTPVFAIQVVFRIGQEPEVRLNEQVGGIIEARAKRAVVKGEPVTSEDIGEIARVQLSEEDANAAHITALQLADGWSIAWDGRYNASIIAAHLDAAHEFVELAEVAVERKLMRGFVETAFEAAELLAKAEVLSLPDAQLLTAKTHATIASRFNWWANLGNTEQRFALLLNELEGLRAPARYLRGEFGLQPERATEMLAVLKSMEAHSKEVAPGRFAPPFD